MGIKELIKPTSLKIFLTIILLIISTPLLSKTNSCNPTSYGFPLKYFQFNECFDVSPCIDTTEPGPHTECESIGLTHPEASIKLILNILFWYIISSIIILIYHKISRRNER